MARSVSPWRGERKAWRAFGVELTDGVGSLPRGGQRTEKCASTGFAALRSSLTRNACGNQAVDGLAGRFTGIEKCGHSPAMQSGIGESGHAPVLFWPANGNLITRRPTR